MYGTESSHSQLRDLTIKPHAIYKYAVIDLSTPPFDAYRKLIAHVRKTSADVALSSEAMTFQALAYDWREGTKQTAGYIAEQICELASAEGITDLYIIAHSMGGLVAKRWMRDELPKKCGGQRQLRVRAVAFVGTPHLGAPRAVEAIQRGVALLPWYDVRGLFERVSSSLNQSVLWFPSSYELLPILENAECRRQVSALAGVRLNTVDLDLGRAAISASQVRLPDFHDVGTWLNYDVLRFVQDQKFEIPPKEVMEKRLIDARESMCELALFDPRNTVTATETSAYWPVLYVSGLTSKNTTPVRSQVSDDATRLSWIAGKGDGSVPLYSARNPLVASDVGQHIMVMDEAGEHLAMLTSKLLLTIVDSWITQIGYQKGVQRQAASSPSAKPGQAAPASKEPGAVLPALLPMLPEPDVWDSLDSREINRRNQDILRRARLSPSDYRARLGAGDGTYVSLVRLSAVGALFAPDSVDRAEALLAGAEWASDLQQALSARKLAKVAGEKLAKLNDRSASPRNLAQLHERASALHALFDGRENLRDVAAIQALKNAAAHLASHVSVASTGQTKDIAVSLLWDLGVNDVDLAGRRIQQVDARQRAEVARCFASVRETAARLANNDTEVQRRLPQMGHQPSTWVPLAQTAHVAHDYATNAPSIQNSMNYQVLKQMEALRKQSDALMKSPQYQETLRMMGTDLNALKQWGDAETKRNLRALIDQVC